MISHARQLGIIAISLLIVLLFQGCIPVSTKENATEISSTPTSGVITWISETFTPSIPTQSPQPLRETPTSSLTSPIQITLSLTTSTPTLISSCNYEPMSISTDSEFGLEGTIAYYDYEKNQFYSVGGQPLIYSQLPISGTWKTNLLGFSPDGNWLAYWPPGFPPAIGLLSVEGEHLELEPDYTQSGISSKELGEGDWVFSGGTIHGWLNNHLLYINVAYQGAPGLAEFQQAVFDPFSKTWQTELRSNLPNLHPSNGFAVSPDLTRALYLTRQRDFLLWDLSTQSPIWKIHNATAPSYLVGVESGYINWASNSSAVAFSGPERLGDLERLGVYIS